MYKIFFYIHFTSSPETIVSNAADYDKFIKEIISMVDRADCERGAHLLVERANVEQFVSSLESLKDFEEFIGTFSSAEIINLLLQEMSIHDWKDEPVYESEEWKTFYRQFSTKTKLIAEDCPDILKETAERLAIIVNTNNDKAIILDIGDAFDIDHLSIIRVVGTESPEIFNIKKSSTFKQLEDWIYDNIPIRSFNYDDNRHIENHPRYVKGKSPILGGLGGKKHLATLLARAMGDARVKDYLVNKDPDNQNFYVRFEYENVLNQNQYHGYHIVTPLEHDPNHKEITKLPERVIRLLEYREKANC